MSLVRTTVDFNRAVSILVAIVKDFGPLYAAPSGDAGCTYFVQDTKENAWGGSHKFINVDNLRPVCIVGQVFSRLGIMRALLSGDGDQYSTCQPDALLWANAEEMGVDFTEEARSLFRQAQYKQDNGQTWRDAVTEAVAEAQAEALAEFQRNSDLFRGIEGYMLDLPAVPEPEPLAEWEKELLGASDYN